MGTNPVNLIDAIADTNVRQARSNTATVRIGKITNPPSGGSVDVSIGGFGVACQWLTTYYPVVGDVVAVIASKDGFLVIGSVNNQPNHHTGLVGPLAGAYATGWGAYATYPNYGNRIGPLAFIRFNTSRTGADLAVNTTTGNVTDTLIFSISDQQFWPWLNRVAVMFWTGSGFFASGFMDLSGNIYINSLTPGQTAIATGVQMGTTVVYAVDVPA
jgi:hypothetical protein